MRRTVWMWGSSRWRSKQFPKHPRHQLSTIQSSNIQSKCSTVRLLQYSARQSAPRAESPIPRAARGPFLRRQGAGPASIFPFMKEAHPLWVDTQLTVLKTTKASATRVINANGSRSWHKMECSNRIPWMIITFGSVLSRPADMFSR